MLAKILVERFSDLDDLVGSTVFRCSHASRCVTDQIVYVGGEFIGST